MRAYPLKLRKKIVEAFDRGQGTQRQLAKRFGVSKTFVNNLLKLRQQTGKLDPNPSGGGQPYVIDSDKLELLRLRVKENPQATLKELRDYLATHTGISVHNSTICRALQRLGMPQRKNRHTAIVNNPRRAALKRDKSS